MVVPCVTSRTGSLLAASSDVKLAMAVVTPVLLSTIVTDCAFAAFFAWRKLVRSHSYAWAAVLVIAVVARAEPVEPGLLFHVIVPSLIGELAASYTATLTVSVPFVRNPLSFSFAAATDEMLA